MKMLKEALDSGRGFEVTFKFAAVEQQSPNQFQPTHSVPHDQSIFNQSSHCQRASHHRNGELTRPSRVRKKGSRNKISAKIQ